MTSQQIIKGLTLSRSSTIRDAAQLIQTNLIKFVIVCDADGRLVGTVTDGDIRRSILAGLGPDSSIHLIMNLQPQVTRQSDDPTSIRTQMRHAIIRHLPVVDAQGYVLDLFHLDDPEDTPPLPNWVVLMAGGLGERLRPLTDTIPKPLLTVGGKPVLERTIDALVQQGFRHFYLSINHLGHMIEDYFGDGSQFGIKIHYIREARPLGTAGSLCGLERPNHPFVVMNGDLLTRANVRAMVELCQQGVKAVVGTREYAYTVPYGCLTIHGDRIKSIDEKPTFQHLISAGMYVLSPESLDFIDADVRLDMPDLLRRLIDSGHEILYHPVGVDWIDIGSKENLDWARKSYSNGESDD